jgi:hypothetical protein
VLASRYDFHAGLAAFTAVYYHFNLIYTVVVPRQLISLFLRMVFDCLGYFDVFAGDSEKHLESPSFI